MAGAIPHPDVDAGSQVTYWLVRHALDLGAAVTFAAIGDPPEDEYTWEIRRLGARIVPLGDANPGGELGEAVTAADACICVDSADSVQTLRRARSESSRPIPVAYLSLDLREPSRAVPEAAGYADELAARFAKDRRSVELAALESADFAGVVSESEVNRLRARGTISHPFLFNLLRSDPQVPPLPSSEGRAVVFVGGFRHPPNVVSMDWFIDKVWPLVFASTPDARLRIFGSGLSEDLRRRWQAEPGVRVVGRYLNGTDPYVGAKVAVAPMLLGGGVNGKVVEAMGFGVPVVGTTVTTEGLPADMQAGIEVADNATEMAAAIVRLLTDASARDAIRRQSLAAYDRSFSQVAGRRAVASLIELLSQ